jgi:hypothetical protein
VGFVEWKMEGFWIAVFNPKDRHAERSRGISLVSSVILIWRPRSEGPYQARTRPLVRRSFAARTPDEDDKRFNHCPTRDASAALGVTVF